MLYGTAEMRRNERAARTWREARSPREAWKRFALWLKRSESRKDHDDGDAPYAFDARRDFSMHTLFTGASAKRLILFEKSATMHAFNSASHRVSPTRWHAATATVPSAPSPLDIDLISAHARMLRVPTIGYVGDLDPHGIHVFGALRSGKLDAPDIRGRRLSIHWLGVDDRWLRSARRTKRPLLARTIQMSWVSREYWSIVKRLMPKVEALIGEACCTLLDTGTKAESDSFLDVMPALLGVDKRR